MPSVQIPHVAMPFSLMRGGRAQYNDQGSSEDVATQVLNVCSCPQGGNPYDPSFGRPQLLGATEPFDLQALTDAVQRQVPDLTDLEAEQSAGLVAGAVNVALTGYIDSPQ
jgi:hypothetical protein